MKITSYGAAQGVTGSKHLIEVMDLADLKKVRYSRFEKRLSEARNAFDAVQLFFRGHKLENDVLKVLSKISKQCG